MFGYIGSTRVYLSLLHYQRCCEMKGNSPAPYGLQMVPVSLRAGTRVPKASDDELKHMPLSRQMLQTCISIGM